MHSLSSCVPFVDTNGTVFMVAGGMPRDVENWTACTNRAFAKTTRLRKQLRFAKKKVNHRRGDFHTARRGISHGGGQTVRTYTPVVLFVLKIL